MIKLDIKIDYQLIFKAIALSFVEHHISYRGNSFIPCKMYIMDSINLNDNCRSEIVTNLKEIFKIDTEFINKPGDQIKMNIKEALEIKVKANKCFTKGEYLNAIEL